MDSTPNPNPRPLSIKASARKLPIKRKHPDSSSSNPNPNSPPILTPKFESLADEDDYAAGDRKPPPFKFHRIWTEPDEIRFLQGLLDSSSDGLSFPRDLNIFYSRFSGTMSQPYTKSQLSEKIRRLRKKYRVISSRLAKGLNKGLLSPHDRALYEISRQLWHPDFSFTSPFNAPSNKPKNSNLVGVEVSFSPTLPSASMIHELNDNTVLNCADNGKEDDGLDVEEGDVKLSEVNVEFEDGVGEEELAVPNDSSGEIGQIAAKIVVDVFDQSLKEIISEGPLYPDHRGSSSGGFSKESFENRWREQRVAELDVLARRLRLVFEHSLPRH